MGSTRDSASSRTPRSRRRTSSGSRRTSSGVTRRGGEGGPGVPEGARRDRGARVPPRRGCPPAPEGRGDRGVRELRGPPREPRAVRRAALPPEEAGGAAPRGGEHGEAPPGQRDREEPQGAPPRPGPVLPPVHPPGPRRVLRVDALRAPGARDRDQLRDGQPSDLPGDRGEPERRAPPPPEPPE